MMNFHDGSSRPTGPWSEGPRPLVLPTNSAPCGYSGRELPPNASIHYLPDRRRSVRRAARRHREMEKYGIVPCHSSATSNTVSLHPHCEEVELYNQEEKVQELLKLARHANSIQKRVRSWLVRRQLQAVREEQARMQREQQREEELWWEMRKSRPVQLVCELEMIEPIASPIVAEEKARASRDSTLLSLAASEKTSISKEATSPAHMQQIASQQEELLQSPLVPFRTSDSFVEFPDGSHKPADDNADNNDNDYDGGAATRHARRATNRRSHNAPRRPTAHSRSPGSNSDDSSEDLLPLLGVGSRTPHDGQTSQLQVASRPSSGTSTASSCSMPGLSSFQRMARKLAKGQRANCGIDSPIRPAFSERAFSERAALSLRHVLERQREMICNGTAVEVHTNPTMSSPGISDSSGLLRAQYVECCKDWQVKPNSQALASFETACISFDCNGLVQASYDFGNAHLGDRGVTCVLHALALDQQCRAVSLRACSLYARSSVCIAVFLELHPRLKNLDLSQNGFSYEAGERLLNALQNRRRRSSSLPFLMEGQPGKRRNTIVELGGTALAWGHGGITVAPPAGNIWSCGDFRLQFAPSRYEALRGRLEETERITYNIRSGPRTPSLPQSQRQASKRCERTPSPDNSLPASGTSRASSVTTPTAPLVCRSNSDGGTDKKETLSTPSRRSSLPAVKPPKARPVGLLLPGASRSARF